MTGLDHNGHTLWLQHFGKSQSDLLGEALLYLQSTREHLSDSSELGQPDHAAIGDVADVHLFTVKPVPYQFITAYLSSEWDEVMLAQRVNLDVLYNDQLVVVLMKDGTVDDFAQILLVALCEEEKRLGITIWRVSEAFSIRIFAYALENSPDCAGEFGQTFVLLFQCGFFALTCPFA